VRLPKEDSMDDDGPILTANSHGDNILCNTPLKDYTRGIG